MNVDHLMMTIESMVIIRAYIDGIDREIEAREDNLTLDEYDRPIPKDNPQFNDRLEGVVIAGINKFLKFNSL